MPKKRDLCLVTFALYVITPMTAAFVAREGFATRDVNVDIYRICVDISAALIEELLFRGIILLDMCKYLKIRSINAVFLSSVLFSSAHLLNLANGQDLGSTLLQVLFAFCVGVSLGALTVSTESIVSAIFLHVIVNLSLAQIATPTELGNATTQICICLAIFYLLAGLCILRKKEKREENHNEALH